MRTHIRRVVESYVLVQVRNSLYFFRFEIERGGIEVLESARRAVRLGDDDEATLRRPAEKNLRWRLVVLGCNLGNDGVFKELRALDSLVPIQFNEGLRAETNTAMMFIEKTISR